MHTWAYVFISTRQPAKVVRAVRRMQGVVIADAVFGSPDVIALVAGADIADMDAVIDRIAELRLVLGTDSKVARWIDAVEPPGLPGGDGGRKPRPRARGARRGRKARAGLRY